MGFVVTIGFLVLICVLIFLTFGPLYTVNQQSAAIVQRFGKFVRVAHSGLNYRTPLIETVAGRINLRVQQLDVKVETKTEDNVFVHFQKSIPGTSAQDVMNLVLMTQYFDTLKEIGASSETNTILIPHSPGYLSDLSAQMRTAMISADLATHGVHNHHHDEPAKPGK